jgi:hypothetical protein
VTVQKPKSLVSGVCALLAVAVLAVVTAGPAAPATTRPLVGLKVPLDQNVRALVGGRFVEKVTCTQRCAGKTTLYIRATLAKRLGFKGVTGDRFAIASKSVTLPARTQVTIRVPLADASKKRMVKVDFGIQVITEVVAQSRTTSRRGTADSLTYLKP